MRAAEGQVAQLVEQRTENPRVGGSNPSLATTEFKALSDPLVSGPFSFTRRKTSSDITSYLAIASFSE